MIHSPRKQRNEQLVEQANPCANHQLFAVIEVTGRSVRISDRDGADVQKQDHPFE